MTEKTAEASISVQAAAYPHVHLFRGVTAAELGHTHVFEFYTYPVNGSGNDQHFHTFQGHTYFNAEHFHRYVGITGPPIPLPGGSHYHEVAGAVRDEPFIFKGNYYKTNQAIQRHEHAFSASSGLPLGVPPAGW